MPKNTITPGEWDVQNKGNLHGSNARHEVVAGNNIDGSINLPTICIMPDLSERSYANAQAIAAVPDMIEALNRIIAVSREKIHPDEALGMIENISQAALRKANQLD